MCINTDDLGVFDTSLEFEYALLFRALGEQKDADGRRRYSDWDIYHYLRSIQEMGLQAVFPPPVGAEAKRWAGAVPPRPI